jgi:hypothetical protein
MIRIDSLRSRLRDLEDESGMVTLSDGNRFDPSRAIRMLFNATKLRRDLGRKPVLSDFSNEEQYYWCCFSKWNPNSNEFGQLSKLVCEMANELVNNS